MPQFGYKLDTRDGKRYRTVLMPDGKWWLAEDLAYRGVGVLGGTYYRREDFAAAVIPGCHIPTGPIYSDNEWQDLANACGGNAVAGGKLKSTSGWDVNGTDEFGFNAKPTGKAGYYGGAWYYSNDFGNASWGFTTDNVGSPYCNTAYIDASNVFLSLVGSTFTGNSENASAFALRLIVDSGNVPDVADPPIIYPPSGSYTSVQYIGATVAMGTIRYTLDGSTPTATSPVLTGPIKITSNTLFKAVTFYGPLISDVSEADYTISGPGVDITPITASYPMPSNDILRIPGYPAYLQPLLLEQYKADNR